MADNTKQDLFALAKTVDIEEYLENFYGIEFNRAHKAECPFCGSKDTPAFSIHTKKQIVKCFSCMPNQKALNIVDFVMEHDKLSDHEAAKKICIDMNLYVDNDPSIDDEERQKRIKKAQEERAKLQKDRDAKRAIKAAEEEKARNDAMYRAKENAPTFLDAFTARPDLKEESKKLFRWSEKLDTWYFDYIGYDAFHESLVIVNQDRENDIVYNIKHRQRWAWNDEQKKFTPGIRAAGKWLSLKDAPSHPFPIEYFRGHKDERVIISFGEKDALNLLSYDINTLTLGGISNSFEPFKELLRDKVVYIWPDNQIQEYIAAMSRYSELEGVAKEIYIVSFFHIDQTLPQKYDISDFILQNQFAEKKDIFQKIRYSCFKLTNAFIEDVADFFHEDVKFLKLLENFRSTASSVKFREIKHAILKVSKPVKGELDQEINATEMCLKAAKNHTLLKEFRDFLSQKERDEAEPFMKTLSLAMDYKARLYDQFRKHHEVDVTLGFLNDAKTSGHEIATFRTDFYMWAGTHYQKIDREKDLETFIIQQWMRIAKVNMKQQTPDFMKKVVDGVFYRAVKLDDVKMEQNYRVINFENGTGYLYNNGKFVFRASHLRADAATNMLPFSYNKNATAPKWQQFLNDALPNQVEQDALMEFIGYCFLNSHRYQKFLYLIGSGANGKSVVQSVIRRFFGDDLISNVDIQNLYSHEMVNIEDKYINIGSEINPKGLDKGQLENLKKMTAGESVQINHKHTKPYDISGGSIPKIILSGNKKVQSGLDGGLFRRMLYLNFNRTFSGKERIQALEERFADELGGIFNMAIDGLHRLMKNNDFSMSDNMKRSLEEYKEEADPILAYVNENITADEGVMIPRKFLYAHYKKWTEERGHHSASDRTFFTRVRDLVPNAKDTQPSYNGKNHEILGNRPRFIENIRIDGTIIEEFAVDKKPVRTDDINIDRIKRLPISVYRV
jgi:P4 family phage/plasmid primase-like protien